MGEAPRPGMAEGLVQPEPEDWDLGQSWEKKVGGERLEAQSLHKVRLCWEGLQGARAVWTLQAFHGSWEHEHGSSSSLPIQEDCLGRCPQNG